MTIDITQLVIAIITVLFGLVTRYAVPWLLEKIKAAKRENTAFWCLKAVEAAEKLFKESGMGKAKKEYVVKFLEEKGFKLNADEVDVLIESSVLTMQNALAEALKK